MSIRWEEQSNGGEGRGVKKGESGIGQSAAVQYKSAPGIMEEGSDGGLGLRDGRGKKDT